MLAWRPALPLDPDHADPLFLQIAHHLSQAIREGSLRPGAPLPGTRAMATHLGVNRNTVVAAYQELAAEGLVESRPGGGTFVADSPPTLGTDAPAPLDQGPAFRLQGPPSPGRGPHQGSPPHATGEIDPRLLPTTALARAYQRALRTRDRGIFSHAQPAGLERFRTALADMLSGTRGIPARAETLLIANSLPEALGLVCRALLAPGEAIAVEALGSRSHWEALQLSGHPLLPMALDPEGVEPGSVKTVLAQGARLLLVTSHRQYPTTVTLGLGRRAALLEATAEARVPILDVDLDPGFQFEGPPTPPLAAQDRTGSVIYLGAFSRLLFPSLPVAFLHGPPALIQTLAQWRSTLGPTGDPFLQRALAELIEDGELHRHLNRLRRSCLERRDTLLQSLRRHLPEAFHLVPPLGGQSIWLPLVDPHEDADGWAVRAMAAGIPVQSGSAFALEGVTHPALRISFGGRTPQELEALGATLARIR